MSVTSTSRSVPAGEVTVMRAAARQAATASRTMSFIAGSGTSRARMSGCSFETVMIRAPDFRIAAVSGACIRPSTVRSMTRSESHSRATASLSPVRAVEAPVERMIGPAEAGLLGTVTTSCASCSSPRAAVASVRLSCRLRVSARTVTVSPDRAAHRSKTRAKAACQCGSIRASDTVRPDIASPDIA